MVITPKAFLFAGLMLFVFSTALCQVNYKNLTRAHGLSSDNVYFSLCDSKGLMWFGTDNGVCRYDGAEFKIFDIDDGITDNEVFRIFEDSKGRIWILPYNGQLCFILNNQVYHTGNTPWLRGFNNKDFFTDMVEDGEGNIWFFKEQNQEFCILENNLQVKYGSLPFKSFYNNHVLLHGIHYIIYNTKIAKKKWVYTVAILNRELKPLTTCSTNQYCRYFFTHQDSLRFGCFFDDKEEDNRMISSNSINFEKAIREKVNPISLLGSRKINDAASLFHNLILTSENGAILIKPHEQETWLPGIFVSSVSIDKENGVWLTTKNNGVFYYPASLTKPVHSITDPIYLIKQNPLKPQELYAASNSFIYRLNGKKTEKISLPAFVGKNEPISDIIFLNNGHLVLSNGNGVYFYNGKKFQLSEGKAGTKQMLYMNDTLYFARSNSITLQAAATLLQPYDLHHPLFIQLHNNRALCLVPANQNEFLFGNNFGAWRISKSGKTVHIPGIQNRIHRIAVSPKSHTAYCSDINGVYIQYKNELHHYTNQNGLTSNSVTSACFDANNNLWVATPNGISRIHSKTHDVINYHLFSGNRDEKIYDLYLNSDTTLLLATGSGLFEFNTTQKPSDTKPDIIITQIKVNGQNRELSTMASLSSVENTIEIALTAISYALPQPDFFYRIGGNGSEWQKISGRVLTFANLPPGSYDIHIRCKSINGLWSNTRAIHFEIHAPVYKKWWFMWSTLAVLASTIVLIIYHWQKRIRKNKEIELLLSETRQKAMRAQLNPHFVFNALNSIQFLYMSHREEQAIEYLNKFSVVLRNILKHAEQTYIRIDEEIENIRSYLDIEQLRLNDRFTYSIETANEIDPYACLIPSMLLQPFIENSIWHGFKGINYMGMIDIRIAKHNEQYLTITISDNGVGFDTTVAPDPSVSKGRQLIENRIAALNKLNKLPIRVNTASTKSGTIIHILFPIQY